MVSILFIIIYVRYLFVQKENGLKNNLEKGRLLNYFNVDNMDMKKFINIVNMPFHVYVSG
jgi:hypothetical protein